ncbi:MAG: cytochrome c biogenesis protein CcdA [Brevinematales bacterium]|jgi:cytochrome c-type biogenesis protein
MRYLIALTGGMITFISPCVLPLVPVYIAYITGISVSDLESGGKNKPMARIFINTLAFVAGFSIVFSLLAALLFIFLQFLGPYKEWFNRIAGFVIIIFGLQMAGLLKFKFLSGEAKFSPAVRKISPGSSFIIGAAFGGGWTPCVGPVLSSILLTSTAGTGWTGGAISILLLLTYSAGLGVPFILTGLLTGRLFSIFAAVKKNYRVIEIISAIFLVALGVMLTAGWTGYVSGMFSKIIHVNAG